MTQSPTRTLDYYIIQSDSGETSGRKDVPEGPQGSVIPISPSGTPQDTTRIEDKSVLCLKPINHTSQPSKTQNKGNNGVSRTRWTDEDWRKEYWRNTNEHPKELVRRTLEKENIKTTLLLDHILNGYHDDKRKRGMKNEDGLIADGNWYNLCQLVILMKNDKTEIERLENGGVR